MGQVVGPSVLLTRNIPNLGISCNPHCYLTPLHPFIASPTTRYMPTPAMNCAPQHDCCYAMVPQAAPSVRCTCCKRCMPRPCLFSCAELCADRGCHAGLEEGQQKAEQVVNKTRPHLPATNGSANEVGTRTVGIPCEVLVRKGESLAKALRPTGAQQRKCLTKG